MDEHTIKKRKYLSKVFEISEKTPQMQAPLIEIVKTYPICMLDVFFSELMNDNTSLFIIYSEKCGGDNAEFVKHITQYF
jgi:hypothetical protein